MNTVLCIVCVVNLFFSFVGLIAREKQTIIQPFTGTIAQGGVFRFDQYPDARAFVFFFTCNHCPFAQLYIDRVNAFHKKYSAKGIPLIAINPMDSLIYEDETLEGMKAKALSDSFAFPYVQDPDQTIATMFGAKHTPQVFVVQSIQGKWTIVYNGIIDDNGKEPEKAIPYLTNAVEAILNHRPIEYPFVKSFGCTIYYRKKS